MLAPESGDTFCLITVLPHDKANAYAAGHVFSVNQVLGVLEVRDEAALEQLQPSLETVAATAEKLLFAHVSDADLKRLGVDEQIIPVVRLLASEAHLQALQSVLPDVQFTALLALATGMTVEQAWSEVAQYLPALTPPQQVDPGDLVTAMERTPGQVAFVSGEEELKDILAHPFAAWRIFLHPSQRRIAYETSYSGPAQVTGGAGTGKTVTALHRAAHLARRQPEPDAATQATGPPILLTTFTRNLADTLGSQLALLIDDDAVRDRIEVLNVDRLAHRIVTQARGANPAIADNQHLRALWTAAAAQTGAAFTPEFLQHEWEQVILGQDLHTEQAYLTCLRAGRGTPLSKIQRSQAWRATGQVVAELQAAGQSTFIQLANEATHILRQSLRATYRHVLVDEAQDLHPAQWRLLRAAVKEAPDDLFIVADPHQRIYDNHVSLASLGIGVRGRSRRLRINYRTTQEILAWAVPLLGTSLSIGLDGAADSLAGYRSPMHGRRPQVRAANDREEELKILTERLRGWIADGIEPHAIGVAARSTYLAKHARDVLESAGIATRRCRQRARKCGPRRDHARHERSRIPGRRRHRRRGGHGSGARRGYAR